MATIQRACGVAPGGVAVGVTTGFEAPAYEVVRLYVLDDLAVDAGRERYLPAGGSVSALTLIASVEEPGIWRMAGVGRVMAPGMAPRPAVGARCGGVGAHRTVTPSVTGARCCTPSAGLLGSPNTGTASWSLPCRKSPVAGSRLEVAPFAPFPQAWALVLRPIWR